VKQHSLRLPDGLWDDVEQARGDVPRNTWIIRAMEEKLHPIVMAVKPPTVEDANRLTLNSNGRQHAINCQCPVCKPPKRTT
jgi:hypothetical protein